MANVTFKLTDNQKLVAQYLYHNGNLVGDNFKLGRINFNIARVKELIAKGVIEKTNGNDPINYYELQFTETGQAWADVMFGDTTPDPDPSEPVADEPVTPSPVVAENETPAPFAEDRIELNPAPCIWCGENPALSDSLLCADCFENDRPTSREKHTAGDIVDILGIRHEVQSNGILKQLPHVASKPTRLIWRGTRRDAVKQVAEALCRNWRNLDNAGDFDSAVNAALNEHCSFAMGNVKDNYDNIRKRLIADAQDYLESNLSEFNHIVTPDDTTPVAAPRYLVGHEAWKGYFVTDSATGEPKSARHVAKKKPTFEHEWSFMANSEKGDLAYCELCGQWRFDIGKPFKMSYEQYQEWHNTGVIDAKEILGDPVASKPVSGVTWVTMDDLPMPPFRNALHRVTFMTWLGGLNTHTTAVDKPTRDLKARKVSTIMNMQKRRMVKPTVAKKQPLRETVLEIVSHLETPLAPQTERRVA